MHGLRDAKGCCLTELLLWYFIHKEKLQSLESEEPGDEITPLSGSDRLNFTEMQVANYPQTELQRRALKTCWGDWVDKNSYFLYPSSSL